MGGWTHPGQVEPVHRHRQRVDGLLIRQGAVLLVARLGEKDISFCAEKEICHLKAGDEDDDRNNDTDDDGGGGGNDDVVEPLALAHTLGPDLPALRERHVGRGDLHLVRDKTLLVEMVKMQNPKVLTRLMLKMMGWLHLLKTDHTDHDALVVRNVLDLELALTRSQGWALLELWRSKESG